MEDYRIYSRVTKTGKLVEFKYSPEDQELVDQYTWSISSLGYVRAAIYCDRKQTFTTFHKLVMNTPKGMVTDHISGDKLDNTRPNLRVCELYQNSINQKISTKNNSGCKGVYWSNRDNRWIATITINKKTEYLLSTSIKTEAIAARKEAEEKYFGEYRRKE